MKVGYNATFFIDGLKALGDGDIVIEFSSDEGQTRMKRVDDSSFLYMLMPTRLSHQDIADDELNDSDSDSDSDETQAQNNTSEGEPEF